MLHSMDMALFFMAISYGYFQDGQKDYNSFDDSLKHVIIFKIMLIFAWTVYFSIAYFGGAHGLGLTIYSFYIFILLAFEDFMYTQKIVLSTSFWGILVIEIVREAILVYAGFWRLS